jgi:hypothetical protein
MVNCACFFYNRNSLHRRASQTNAQCVREWQGGGKTGGIDHASGGDRYGETERAMDFRPLALPS